MCTAQKTFTKLSPTPKLPRLPFLFEMCCWIKDNYTLNKKIICSLLTCLLTRSYKSIIQIRNVMLTIYLYLYDLNLKKSVLPEWDAWYFISYLHVCPSLCLSKYQILRKNEIRCNTSDIRKFSSSNSHIENVTFVIVKK